jgi:hypothetical protein
MVVMLLGMTNKTYTVRNLPCSLSTRSFIEVHVTGELLPWTHATKRAAGKHLAELKADGFKQVEYVS